MKEVTDRPRLSIARFLRSAALCIAALGLPMAAAAQDRATLETPAFERYGDRRNDVLYRVILAADGGTQTLSGVSYQGTSYTLTDGTVVNQTRQSSDDVFVSCVIEHRNASKSVVIVPANEATDSRLYERFLALRLLVGSNPDKAFSVLFGDYTAPDAPATAALQAIRIRLADESQISSAADLIAETGFQTRLTPAAALYLTDRSIEASRIPAELEPQGADGTDDSAKHRIEQQQRRSAVEDQVRAVRDSYEAFAVSTFVADFETTLQRAVSEAGGAADRAIPRINALQREVATLILAGDFVDRARNGTDTHARGLMRSIDDISGSRLVSKYEGFAAHITAADDATHSLMEAATSVFPKGEPVGPAKRADDSQLDEQFADALSAMPGGSVIICELPRALIENQIILCFEHADYNLIVYEWPTKPKDSAHDEESAPADRQAPLFAALSPILPISDLGLPSRYQALVALDPRLADVLTTELNIAAQAYRDYQGKESETAVHYFAIPDLGAILRLTRWGSRSTADRYYFVPGADLREQTRAIDDGSMLSGMQISDDDRRVIEKWSKVVDASTGL